ncbi:MAG: DsbA family protein [Rickettsiales bacterium]|nr:DsbA family protein [Rickettsiales bacterium]
MSLLNKDNFESQSFVKPIMIVVAVLLIVGGAYSLFGSKSKESKNENAAEVNSSGLDPDMKVKNVADVEKVMAKWIEANPKAIIDSVANMQKKAMEDQQKDSQKNIIDKKADLESESSPSVSPSGYDVTIVEFFDYSCGYCKKAQATVETLLKDDNKVRVIFKEFPILGQASVEMSQVAIAVHLIDKNAYRKFHEAMMKSSGRGKAEAIKVAKSVGVDSAKLEATLKNDQAKIDKILQDNSELGHAIGINGTPGFVIGEELIPGAIDVNSFKEKISALRNKK